MWELYQKLLSELPDIVRQKVFEKDMVTDLQRSVVVNQLVSRHKGEVVELDRARTSWKLVRKAPGSASWLDWENPQRHYL